MILKTGGRGYIGWSRSIRFKPGLKHVGKLAAFLAVMAAPYVHAVEEPAITAYKPVITETVDENGFLHPGVGVTKEVLENLRLQIEAKQEPWYSYYVDMLESSAASRTVTSSNRSSSDFSLPASTAFNSQGINSRFIADGLKAYTQAILYYVTGDDVYRANAMDIIRIWSNMDPDLYTYFQDAHIHTGIPMNRMMTAAEIMRYTSTQVEELKWTQEDTEKLTNNLITPVIETFQHRNNEFMNQHTYPLMGAMAGYIFTSNLERYTEAVEWMTVNKGGANQGFNGSIKRLFRLVEENANTAEKLATPVVQHVEMGRDQAHGGGDLNNAAIIARMFLAQNTKVDPVDGTASIAADAVDIYEFLDDRILAASNYFWQYMMGYPTDWVPTPFSIASDGTVRGIYQRLSRAYRGRLLTTNHWDLYYYYTYERGVDLEQKAPYLHEAFVKRVPSNFYSSGNYTQTWNNVDGGGDFWLYIPEEAATAEGDKYLPPEQTSNALVEVEERYIQFDNNSSTKQEGDTSYIELFATPEGTNVSFFNLSFRSDSFTAIKVRTNGEATLSLSNDVESSPYKILHLPNTGGGWTNITFDGGPTGSYKIVNLEVEGNGTAVDIDHFNVRAASTLTPPEFNSPVETTSIISYAGAPISSSLAATDSGADDTVTYSATQLPVGATLDPATGLFNWDAAAVGGYSFVVVASDSETIATREVLITVVADRASAVATASQQYDPEAVYTAVTAETYNSVYEATNGMIDTATDAEFGQQLEVLVHATEALKLVTPRLADGSIDFADLVDSSFGNGVYALTDGDNGSATGFISGSNLFHTLDFGQNYKVLPTAFGIQSRLHFVDRGAGITVYASNDTLTWTRITPEESAYQDDMSILDVDPAYVGEQFRYFRLVMVNPQPDALRNQVLNQFELGEVRIFGERVELDNKLSEVSLSSSDAQAGNLVPEGGTVQISIVAEEVVDNMVVRIQGVEAEVTTTDGIHWTASATLEGITQFGSAIVSVQYDVTDETGTSTQEITYVTDLYLTGGDIIDGFGDKAYELLDPSTTHGRPDAGVTSMFVNRLFDGDPASTTDFRNGGSGAGSYIGFDFGEGNYVSLTGVDILARQDGYYYRINGARVQGSDDGETWTTLSKQASSTRDWQFLAVNDSKKYRFVRLYNSKTWYGNMGEVRFHGTYYGLVDVVETISMHSDGDDGSGVIETGEAVTLSLGATEAIENLEVNIHGVAATVSTIDEGLNWTATAIMDEGVVLDYIQFSVDYDTVAGSNGKPETETTDGSRLYLIDGSDLITNIADIADLIDPSTTHGRPNPEVTLMFVNRLSDGDLTSVTDFRNGSAGNQSYIAFDFGEDHRVAMSAVDVAARQDGYYWRIESAVLQGSHDGENWLTISDRSRKTRDWQTLFINGSEKYRYVRMYNYRHWFGNMAELRLHGEVIRLGDWDGDGDVDAFDVRGFMKAVAMRETIDPIFDLNGDGDVTVLDGREIVKRCTRPDCATSD